MAAQSASDTLGARGWYAQGARAYQAGQDARAAADWIVARRLAPRKPEIRIAWARVARLSRDLSDAGQVSPLTPTELVLLAAAGWAAGWLLLSRRRFRLALLLLGMALLGAIGAAAVTWWYGRPLAVLTREAAMPQAPHGLASESGRAAEFAHRLKPSPRGELEITDLNRCYLDRGELAVEIYLPIYTIVK